jgi:HTH-type transcriptional regulator / antitoxin HipB
MFPYGNIWTSRRPKEMKYSRQGILCLLLPEVAIIFPYGNSFAGACPLRYTTGDIGKLIRETRKKLGVTQKALALTAGTGLRFIIELEKGKETCEVGKALTVLNTLGIRMTLTPPAAAAQQGSGDGRYA